MNFDNRIKIIESRLSHIDSIHKQMNNLLEAMQESDNSALNTSRHLHDSISAAGEVLESHGNIINEINSLNENHIIPIIKQCRNDINFVTLFVYWLAHILERTENLIPYGTTDLIMNSMEENISPSESSFFEMFQSLREAGIEDSK